MPILVFIVEPETSSYTKELFVNILSAAPDQLLYYLPTLQEFIKPRPSDKWINVMEFITEIYNAQNPLNHLKSIENSAPVKSVADELLKESVPSIITRKIFMEALQHQSPRVKYAMLDFLCHTVKRFSALIAQLRQFEDPAMKAFSKSDVPQIIEKLQIGFAQIIPDAELLRNIWSELMSEKPEDSLKTCVDEVRNLLKIAVSLKKDLPSTMTAWSIDLIELFKEVQKFCNRLEPAEASIFQLEVIEMFVENFGAHEKDNIVQFCGLVIPYATEKYLPSRIKAVNVLAKALTASCLFPELDELNIWIKHLKNSSDIQVQKLFVKGLLEYLQSNKEGYISYVGFCCGLLPFMFDVCESEEMFFNNKQCKIILSNVVFDLYHMQSDTSKLDGLLELRKSLITKTRWKQLKALIPKSETELTLKHVENLSDYLLQFILCRNAKQVHTIQLSEINEFTLNLDSVTRTLVIYQSLFYVGILLSEDNRNCVEAVNDLCELLKVLLSDSADSVLQEKSIGIVLNHSVTQRYFLHSDISVATTSLVSQLLESCGKLEYFAWYIAKTEEFVTTLKEYIRVHLRVDKRAKKAVLAFSAHIPISSVVKLLECLPVDLLLSCHWLTEALCQRVVDCILKSQRGYLSSECVAKLFEMLEDKHLGKCIFGLLKAHPPYSCVFKPGTVKRGLEGSSETVLDAINYAIPFNSFLRKEFEDVCREREIASAVSKERLYSILRSYLQVCAQFIKALPVEQQHFVKDKTSIVQMLEENEFLEEITADPSETKIQILQVLIDLSYYDCNRIVEKIDLSRVTSWDNESVVALCACLTDVCNDCKFLNRLLRKVMKLLKKNFTFRSASLDLIRMIMKMLEKLESACLEENIDCDVQAILQLGLSDCDRSDLLEMMLLLIKNNHRMQSSIPLTCELLFGHSNFMPIILNENEDFSRHRTVLFDLIILMYGFDSNILTESHIPVLLASYNATLGEVDQKILRLLHMCEANKINLARYSPFLFGKAAVNYYSVSKSLSCTVNKLPTTEEVIQLFQKKTLKNTAFNFPLDLKLRELNTVNSVKEEMYDPRFLLPLAGHLFAPNALFRCDKVVDSGVIQIAFAALSSNCPDMRQAGYFVLSLFYEHLEGSKFMHKLIWLQLLNCIRYAIKKENYKLPSMMTVFLIKTAYLLSLVDNVLYTPVTDYIMLKPKFDFDTVPDFLKMFHSSDLQFRRHRQWILQLLAEGIRSPFDYFLCKKMCIVRMLLSYSDSPIANIGNTVSVLNILIAIAKIPTAAWSLLHDNAILSYVRLMLLKQGKNNGDIFCAVVHFLHHLWFTTNQSKEKERNTCDIEFLSVHLLCIDLINSNTKKTSWNTLMITLASICECVDKSLEKELIFASLVSFNDIENILEMESMPCEEEECEDKDENSIQHSCSSFIMENGSYKTPINLILLKFSSWILSRIHKFNVSLDANLTKTLQNVIAHILSTSIYRETSSYQLQFFKFLETVFLNDKIVNNLFNGDAQSNKILTSLLTRVSHCSNPKIAESNSWFEVLPQLNRALQQIFRVVFTSKDSEFFLESETFKCAWKELAKMQENISDDKSDDYVKLQFAISLFSSEFLLQKCSPVQFDHFINSKKHLKRKRKSHLNDKNSSLCKRKKIM